ncbi:ABC transporter permease [Terricaulis silvestris]|uniref:ABC transporter permease n=1 Tax=Terricaulis silvestris TaxID=2686094 RepID=UPI001E3E7CAC|nr:ABC transporter permease [Terricaulis silvestris]
MARDFMTIFARWHTWLLMGNQDISMRYRRSFLGPFWISAVMAVMVLSIGFLYAQVQQQPYREFLTYLGCGMVAWTFLSTMISEGCQAVIENEAHLRNVSLPTPLLSARIVYRNIVVLLHNVLVVGIILLLLGKPWTPFALWALPGYALYIVLGLLVSIAVAPICARFRDVPQIVVSLLQVMFFLTPIFWVPRPEMVQTALLEFNPFFHLLEIVRAPLLGSAPTSMNWTFSLWTAGIAGVLAIASQAVSRRRIFLWL